MPNAEQYATLYHLLVGAVDDALSDLEQQRPEEAQTRLQAALLECEQKYLEYTETADEEGPLQETM